MVFLWEKKKSITSDDWFVFSFSFLYDGYKNWHEHLEWQWELKQKNKQIHLLLLGWKHWLGDTRLWMMWLFRKAAAAAVVSACAALVWWNKTCVCVCTHWLVCLVVWWTDDQPSLFTEESIIGYHSSWEVSLLGFRLLLCVGFHGNCLRACVCVCVYAFVCLKDRRKGENSRWSTNT